MKEFLYSRNAVYEALRAGRRRAFRLLIAEGAQEKGRLLDILRLAEQRRLAISRLPRAELDRINAAHQGVILEASGFPYAGIQDMLGLAAQRRQPLLVVLLDTLQDPQNFGTLLRTAEAVGVHGIVLPLARSVTVTPAVVNASSGACEHLLIARYNLAQAMDLLKEAGAWLVGLDEKAAEQAGVGLPLNESLGLVIGSEGEGLRALVKMKCDFLFRLPMEGKIASLNASVAGSVALYLIYLGRQKFFHSLGGNFSTFFPHFCG